MKESHFSGRNQNFSSQRSKRLDEELVKRTTRVFPHLIFRALWRKAASWRCGHQEDSGRARQAWAPLEEVRNRVPFSLQNSEDLEMLKTSAAHRRRRSL